VQILRSGRGLTALAIICWLLVVGIGLKRLWAYAYTPGPEAAAPGSWPATSQLPRRATDPTLVMLLHPQCACSRASIGELAQLMAHVQGQVTVHLLFYRPVGAGSEWTDTELWDSAAAIPGVQLRIDEDGAEAARFGGFVSGQTFLFGADDRLLFHGGITFARGHSGDNVGRESLQALIRHEPAPARRTPVFGCLLGGESRTS
jgi:hypothetical protein